MITSLMLANWVIEAQITSPLSRILGAAQQVASGEVAPDMNLNRCDDIGMIARSINQAGLNLNALVADVYEQAAGVQVASQQIVNATYDLSGRTEQAASSLEQTAAAMEQQTASIQQNSKTAHQASLRTQGATQIAEQGGRPWSMWKTPWA